MPGSRGIAIRSSILEVGGGERKSLMNVIRVQLRIVSKKVIPIGVESHSFHHAAYRQPHAADARLSIQLAGIPRYTIKVSHTSILKHLGTRALNRARNSSFRLTTVSFSITHLVSGPQAPRTT